MIAKEGRVILIPLLFMTFPIGVYAHASENHFLTFQDELEMRNLEFETL